MENPFSSKPGMRAFLAAGCIALACLGLLLISSHAGVATPQQAHALAPDPSPPSETVKLIFIHHSTGENWLDDWDGGLGIALRDNNYFLSDTNYGWGPSSIGDTTDIGHWWDWFRGTSSATYLSAVYAESGQNSSYSRLSTDPGGENEVILFKSCFPNSHLGGNPGDPPTTGSNPLRGQDAWSEYMTVANAKGIYNDILEYFQTRQDKLFVVITAPPLVANETDASHAANARAFNDWLVNDWLDGYSYSNVAVFDFYNVLTSNGGNANTNDLGSETGNHHRWWNSAVQHIQTVNNNFSAYGSDAWDSHPTQAGNQKATGEFVPLLNIFYNNWKSGQTTVTPTPTTVTSTPTPTRTPTATGTPPPTATPTTTSMLTSTPTATSSPTPTSTPTGTATTTAIAYYYVSPDGNDNNPGTEAQPWRTIQKAAETLVAGDTVYIKAGTYQERVIPQNSGSAGNYIVYAAYPGDAVTIDGASIIVPEWGGLFEIVDKNYIRVSGLRIINAGPNLHNPGILVDLSSYIIIENNYVYHTSDSGIGVWDSDNVIIDNNEVEGACYNGYNESISVGGTDGFEVKNNLVHHSQKEGIDAKDGSSNGKVFRNHVHHTDAVGIYVDAWDKHTYNIEVFENVVHDIAANGFALGSEQGGLLENVRVYNNIAYNNKWCGIHLHACCTANRPVRDVTVINNTFYDNGWDPWGGGILVENPDVENVIIRNNICSQNLSFQIAVDASVPAGNVTTDHNLIDGYRGDEGEIYGSDYVEGDPMFVNAAGADFHLQENSPAIDQGSPADAPGDDFEGHARPYGAGYDIGADEFTLYGDLDYDCDVDIADIMLVASHWHTAVGDPDYVAAHDLDGNGKIDIVDIMLVAVHWGENCTTPTTTPTATPTPTSTATPTPTPTTATTPTTTPFPDWAFEARLAGASFESEMTNAEIDAKLQQAADEGVSVLLADAPTGWSYTAWVDGAEFNQVLALMRDRVFPRAHAKGLKVVWYLTALELICEGCVNTGRDPAAEHPEWMQIDRFGNPLQFSGVQGVFWLNPDDLDAWLSPESPYRDFYMDRIQDIATAGADGLWIDVIYLLNAIGQFDDLWPSYDPYSQATFQAAYGHTTLPTKNWNDLTWREFVRWRIESITRFVEDVAAAARALDPDLAFFTENWCMDSNFVTQYAQDPLDFMGNPHVATAHELEPVDQEGSGMANATFKQWRDYVLMVKFAVVANKGKPGWILTYAGAVDDSLREAGVHLAEGANFYEAKGPEMVDDSTGSRPIVFPWLAANADMAYHSTSLAEVALWYSPRSRDFVDGENAGDDKFDYVNTTYIKEYRDRAQDLIKAQIPFDIVTGQWSLAELARYTWLVLPNAACLSDAEATLLREYANAGGKLAVTGDTGAMDEWCQSRATNALAGVTTYSFDNVTSDVLTTNLSAYHKQRVLIEARTGTDASGPFVIVPLANFNKSQIYTNVSITVRLPAGFTPTTVTWNAPDAAGGTLSYSVNGSQLSVTLPTLNTAAAVVIRGGSTSSTPTPTPTSTSTPTATPTSTSTPTPTATSETGVDKWALWTGSTQLRGANIWQRRVYPELDGTTFLGPGPVGPPFTQSDFDSLAALGANYVNISHPGLFTESPPYVLDQDIQDNLDNLLGMIEQAGMFAVISARTGPGRSDFTFYWDGAGDWFDESYLNDSMWQDQDTQDAWVAMWAYTAQRYKDNPIVVGYDLMVEPNSNEVGSHALYDALNIWDPEEFYATYGGTLYDWNQLYPRITTAIRQVDTDTPILIGCMAYSMVEWLPYLQTTGDPRTVYMVHQYEPFDYTHQEPPLTNTYPGVFDTDGDGIDDQFNQTWLDNLLSTVDDFKTTYGVPVSVNEFGVMRWEPGVDEFMDDEMDLFQQRGMNHALWVWDPAWEPWTQEVDAFNFRHGPDPNNHTDVASSDLIDVIVEHWGRNTVGP